MSLAAMVVSHSANPIKPITMIYNKDSDFWNGNISIANLKFDNAIDLINYLNKKYKKIYFFRINISRTFSGNWIKPKELYREDMDHNAEPNCIMVSTTGNNLMLITTKAKRAKEFVAISPSTKYVFVPVMIYKDLNNNIKIINA